MISFVIVEDFSNQVSEIETKVPLFITNLRTLLPNFEFSRRNLLAKISTTKLRGKYY